MIANTIGVKLEVWTGCDLRFQDIQKCTSTSTELRTAVETRNVCSYVNEQHIFKKCPLNRFRIFLQFDNEFVEQFSQLLIPDDAIAMERDQ